MPKDLSFEIDVFDKKAIREKLPELQTLVEEKRKELTELEERYRQLRHWAGLAPRSVKSSQPTSSIEEVVGIVEGAGRPMRARDVVVEMGPDAKRDTAAWALYAPLDYQPSPNGSAGED